MISFRSLIKPFLISSVIVLLVACQKETDPPPENKPPVVNAGADTTFQLISSQRDTIQLKGTTVDNDGKVVGYAWTQISGPNTAKIHYPGAATTNVSGVVSGAYVFQLMATDDKGATGVKSVTITVKSPQIVTITLQPSQNTQERHLAINYTGDASDPTAPEIGAMAWTNSGSPAYVRALLKFDWSAIPAGATIISAKLSLYSNPNPSNGNLVDANYGTSNAFVLQRVVSNWNSSVSWQTQPTGDASSQVIIPHTSQRMLDIVDHDVTGLVNAMHQQGNYGFLIKLQNEVAFNSRIFCSSKNTNASKHPKIVIQYSN